MSDWRQLAEHYRAALEKMARSKAKFPATYRAEAKNALNTAPGETKDSA